MKHRRTKLLIDGFQSAEVEIPGELEQELPLSVILYHLYNSPLLDATKVKGSKRVTGNIDDVAVLGIGRTFDDTHEKLRLFITVHVALSSVP